VDEHRGRFGVEPICSVLGVSASAYYQRKTGGRSARSLEDEQLLARIREVHEANYCAYGYRRTWKALTRAGEQAPRCRVQRLMRTNSIQGAKRRGKPWRTTTPDHDARRRPDLVNRDFTASRPNELWVADFSYLRCWEGVVFFSFVIDVYSRKVVGWQFAGHMRTTLVLDALRMALSTRERVEEVRLTHHSDRGSQTPVNICPATTRRRSLITTSWRRSGAPATPMTTAWPRASSTASRPSSSTTASGAPDHSWSSQSSSTSAGSTTAACMKTSAIGHHARSRNSTLRKTGQRSPHREREKLLTQPPSIPVRLTLRSSGRRVRRPTRVAGSG
jgi:hypothetical protein